MAPSPRRPAFEPDGESLAADAVQDPTSPASDTLLLARFEFESGRGNEGTKVLMVEWEDDKDTRQTPGEWHVSWEGKRTVLPANDRPSDKSHRLYFLLPPRQMVPPIVTLTCERESVEPKIWRVKALPAIFPPELGASARTQGKKGVLHTIWAKKRLSVLQREIEAESKKNFEGIALEMALQEKHWIEQNFGVTARPSISIPVIPGGDYPDSPLSPTGANIGSPTSPATPRSPGGGKLAEKLKGLKVGTSATELNARSTGHTSELPPTAPPTGGQQESNTYPSGREVHPLSPESSDVAISSFAAFRGQRPHPSSKPSSTTSPQGTTSTGTSTTKKSPAPRAFTAQAPPAALRAQQQQQHHRGTNATLNALADSPSGGGGGGSRRVSSPTDDDVGEGLFAVEMSPRTPDTKKSPFSFSSRDIAGTGRKESVS
ncbi:MAG: hypothetical protein M1833_002441 [Piccolia ochrophora]|nr:MAG: hypothetical protein M1833_002441 [Piccolia ochrophora]